MSTFNLPKSDPFRAIVAWFGTLGDKIGILETPDGEKYAVMKPECLCDLDAIVSNPVFHEAISRGISDVKNARTKVVQPGATLRASLDAATKCDPAMADAIEKGVADVLTGRTQFLQPGQSLRDLKR